jgi:hypothetical protein
MNHAGKIEGKNFKTWLKDHFDSHKMQPVMDEEFKKTKKTNFKNDQMDKPGNYTKSDYTVPFKTAQLKEAIKREMFSILQEQGDDLEVPDVDVDDDAAADKAATKGAKKTGKSNRFDLEKEAIKDLLYRGKKGKDSEYTEEEPAPKSILDVKNQMLDLYRSKYKGVEGGVDDYNAELKKSNEKFEKILEKHIEKFGSENEKGLGNNVTLDKVFGESLPDTIKLLGARLKEIEKEEQENVIARTNERHQIALGDMTRQQQIKIIEIIRENGISLREGAMGIKTYYEIAKAAYLEGLSNGLRL